MPFLIVFIMCAALLACYIWWAKRRYAEDFCPPAIVATVVLVVGTGALLKSSGDKPYLIILVMLAVMLCCFVWWIKKGYRRDFCPPVIAAVAIFIIGFGALMHNYTEVTIRTVLITREPDRGGDDGTYRIYTDGDTLAVKDIWFSFSNRRFNSADLFGQIKECHEYVVAVRGWEFGPLLSLMPNIDHIVADHGLVAKEVCDPNG